MANTMGAGEVAESILAMGTIPPIDEVHAQGFHFYPRHWLDRWPLDKYLQYSALPDWTIEGGAV